MIGALKPRAGALAAFDDLRAAVGTRIDEGADLTIGASHDNQWHAGEVERKITTRLRHTAVVANAVPVTEEDALAFALVEPRRRVAPAGQGLGGVPAPAYARIIAGLEDIIRFKIRDHSRYPSFGRLCRHGNLFYAFRLGQLEG